MKPLSLLFLLSACSFLLFSGMKCKKENENPIDQLPPITQEGKGTFGCLVNGQAFTPKGSNLGGPILSSYYQYFNDSNRQGYYFNVSARKDENSSSKSLNIRSNKIEIKSGTKYILQNYESEKETYASYGTLSEFKTIQAFKGELFISHFDETNQIVSGTFWFDAVNDKGEKVEVREGRFDVHFSK